MRPGTRIADRFEVTSSSRFEGTWARDLETGAKVRVVSVPEQYFLDRAAITTQAAIVQELDDPVLVPPLCLSPFVFPEISESLELPALVDAALELLYAVGRARRAGICVDAQTAFFDAEGRLRLPAPSALAGLHVQSYGFEVDQTVGEVANWLEGRSAIERDESLRDWVRSLDWEAEAFARGLCERASVPEAARERLQDAGEFWLRREPALDFDLGIELGESWLREGSEPYGRSYTPMPLAAVYHHRGCVRWQAGHERDARADVARACELDPHARYLTTAALISERDGEAGALLDAAVEALAPVREVDEYGFVDAGVDDPDVEARDAARTLHARAAHRAKRGDASGAIEDLERSLARKATSAAAALLAKLRPVHDSG